MQPKPAYVYILVRSDIPHPHLSVQAAHAVLAATNAFIGSKAITHPNLVLCAVKDEATLADEFNRLKEAGVQCCAWYEDDMKNELTAVATGLLSGPARKPMRKYRLLGASV